MQHQRGQQEGQQQRPRRAGPAQQQQGEQRLAGQVHRRRQPAPGPVERRPGATQGEDQGIAEREGQQRPPRDGPEQQAEQRRRRGLQPPGGILAQRASAGELRPPPGIPQTPAGADRALQPVFPALVESLDQVEVQPLLRRQGEDAAGKDRLIDAGGHSAGPPAATARPAGLADRDRLAGEGGAQPGQHAPDMPDRRLDRNRPVLPIREEVDGHDIDMRGQFRVALPVFPDIGIGDGLRDRGAHPVERRHQRGRAQVAAQQHLIADDHAGDRLRMGVGLGDERGEFRLVLPRLAPEPGARLQLQSVPRRQRRQIVLAAQRSIAADRPDLRRQQRQVGLDLRWARKAVLERRLAGAEGREGDGGDGAGRRGNLPRLLAVRPPPEQRGERQQDRQGAPAAIGGAVRQG
ncbi:hypothetical protein JMJ55_12585 [Belnapia sp. T6]|uniref:Uncharacterized protein n=1 Tax=Belnapia mucosa TaxID=2804532 RepID=A0ABS1V395_9PROT|nr:hypothetical protein [Belnapia mucosa]MBL6456164.1 hypothetical protein [Belnapia mucosa]